MAVFGVWRSWLARLVWDQEAGGSSPLTPTSIEIPSFVEPCMVFS